MHSEHKGRGLFGISLTAALAGFIFGFDMVVISGADKDIQALWNTSAWFHGFFIMSMALWGTVIGSVFGGGPTDRYGRKKVLLLVGLLFTLSAIGSALAQDPYTFSFFRLIGGIGIGISSVAAPTYISEISTPASRGRLVAMYQFNIVFGILVAYLSNYLLSGFGGDNDWRWMLGVMTIPALVYSIMVFGIPESPRWLMKAGREDEALDILQKINGHHSGLEIQREIRETLGEENGTLRELFSGTFRPAIFIGMILAIFSQVQGINAIMYYAPDIFKQVGSGNESAFQQTVIVGIINVAFTWVAIYFVDKWGRKSLLLWGGAGMAISLFMVGAAFQFNWSGFIILIFILAYVACFAASYGPVTWVVIAEIFPIKLRGLAMSVSTLILWVAVYFVTQFFPILLELMGPAYTFWFFCLMSSMAFFYVLKMVPETKNKTLEEIEHSWSK
jgi:sugar porter (SP) family MFS transporter